MCSSNSGGKLTKPYYSTCVAVADFVSSQRCCLLNVASSTEGWLLAQAPFYRLCPHYIGHQRTPKGDRHILSTQCGEERYWLSSFWIQRRNFKPLTSGIVLRYIPPSLHSPRPNSASGFRVRVLHPRFFHVFDDFSIHIWLLAFLIADIFSSWNCRFFYVT
jgi:hypothetical protein